MGHFAPVGIRVLLSDDTRTHTELLADSLKCDGGLQVFSSISSSEELISAFESCVPDVLLLSSNIDEQPGHGFEVLQVLRSSHSDLRAVMLLNSSKPEMALEAFRAGARGVFNKEESVGTLPKCVRKVHEGQIWANTEQVAALMRAWANSYKVHAVNARGIDLLSKREAEIVAGVAEGLTNRGIAKQLGLSPHTVKNCLFRIFDKLGASSRVELLFLTLSQVGMGQPSVRNLLETGPESWLQDKSILFAAQQAADGGVLIAQMAIAQYHWSQRATANHLVQAYKWCSIVKERLEHICQEATIDMGVSELLHAEQMIAAALSAVSKLPRSEGATADSNGDAVLA